MFLCFPLSDSHMILLRSFRIWNVLVMSLLGRSRQRRTTQHRLILPSWTLHLLSSNESALSFLLGLLGYLAYVGALIGGGQCVSAAGFTTTKTIVSCFAKYMNVTLTCLPASLFRSLRFIPSGHGVPLRQSKSAEVESPYQIFYNLYKPSTPFKKTAPPPPDFQIVVIK